MTPSRITLAALVALLGACSTQRVDPGAGWKIEPVLAVRHSPAAGAAYYGMGRYYEGMQRWGDALDAYRRATASDPANVDAWNALGVAHARIGQLDRAEAVLRRALAMDPRRADLRSNLGQVLALAGRSAEAVAELRAALSQDPDNGVTRDNLRIALGEAEPAPVEIARDSSTPDDGRSAAAPGPRPLQVVDTPTLPSWSDRPPPDALPARLEISNGMGASGAAERLRRWLTNHGVATQRLSNAKPYAQATTVIQFLDGHAQAAERLARLLPVPVSVVPATGLQSDVRVLLGRDWIRLATCLDDGCPAPALRVAQAVDPD